MTKQMTNKKVLISGASVAGLSAAYWLRRNGFEPTVVEKSPGLRPGGQAIDVRGVALKVAEGMGILDRLRSAATDIRGMTLVDANGAELFSSTEETLTGGEIGSADVEVLRDDLCDLLYEVARPGVEFIFDDSIESVAQDADGVKVTFDRSESRSFDLVIGADGMHSNVRRLAFGPEAPFIRHLGSYVGVFTAPNFLELDHWQVFQQTAPGGGIVSARNNTESRVYLAFEDTEVTWDYRDIEAQKRLLASRLRECGWVIPQMLEYMWDAPDFHFDSTSQIHMPQWSSDRVLVIGDAAHAGSLFSGQGTSTAMVDGYVLAAELARCDGDHVEAFPAFEERMRPWVALNQEIAVLNVQRRKAEDPSTIEGPTLDEIKNAFTL